MKRPLIGLIPLWDDTKQSIWMLPAYERGILESGGVPITLPFTADSEVLQKVCSVCDGFLLTGGHDVDPALYGEVKSPECAVICSTRDAMEKFVLFYALERDIPILGICRGLQFINAALGGTLFQHLPKEHPSQTTHRQKPPYDKPVHTVSIAAGSPLAQLLGVEQLRVNSCHHQAIKQTAPGLSVMAISEDGLIESACLPDKRFIWGVQWHPEFSFQTDSASRAIFRRFIEASSEEMRRDK